MSLSIGIAHCFLILTKSLLHNMISTIMPAGPELEYLQHLGRGDGEPRKPEDLVLIEKVDSMAFVMINRPSVRNAIDTATWSALADSFQVLGEDSDIRVVVLQGMGDNFSAGADVSEMARIAQALEKKPEEKLKAAVDYFTLARRTLNAMKASPSVIIAKMRGGALGIGNILAHACDLRIADNTVKTGVPAGRLGIMLPPQELRLLIQQVGEANAQKIIFSGEVFDWKDSLAMGQVHMVVKPEALDITVLNMARRVERQSAEAIISARRGFELFHSNPAFAEEDVDPNLHFYWATTDTVLARIRTFQERRPHESPER